MASGDFLAYGRQSIDQDDIAAVAEALRSAFLTAGPLVPAFEQDFCGATGAQNTVACNSGTAALHLAYAVGGVGPGSVVLVPAITFMATANAARYLDAEVVFVDVDPASGLMTPETVAAALEGAKGRRVAAVAPVHLNGWIADVAGIARLARSVGAAVIEDACHALGGAYLDPEGARRRVGDCAHSDAATFSFHPVKTITTGEGGAITTPHADWADRMRRLRSHGIERAAPRFVMTGQSAEDDGTARPWYHEMAELGWNYRATDVACALGRSQLAKLEGFVNKRRRLHTHYLDLLRSRGLPLETVPEQPGQEPGLHLMVVRIDFEALGTTRTRVMGRLQSQGIGSQVHYIPVYRQPYYQRLYGPLRLAGAEAYYERCLSLPLYPDMAMGDVERVVDALGDSLI